MAGFTVEVGEASEAAPDRRAGPCALVLFGATGDLARRKLIPALYHLASAGALPEDFAVVGVSRTVPDAEAWRARLLESTLAHSRTQGVDRPAWDRFATRLHTVAGDLSQPDSLAGLRALLDRLAPITQGNALFYLSTPSSAAEGALRSLSEAGLLPRAADGQPWRRVIVEKPFGRDLQSARALNRAALSLISERQLFRIDHYLGKETVQNLLVLRFGNSIFEPLWNHRYVDHVQITAAESIGIEGRGRFYEETGVLRDIVQNHLLQVLALTAMEAPISFEADEIRDMKSQALRALRPLGDDPWGDVVLGQLEGYRDAEGVAPDSRVPTFAAIRAHIDNWRWQGVPFYLRAGKGLGRRVTEIRIVFKAIPLCLFGNEDLCIRPDPNVLVIRIQPDEGVALRFCSKVPGQDTSVAPVTMDFKYSQGFQKAAPEAYERLLLDAMRGDATLFARRDEVEHAWRYLDPVIQAHEGQPSHQPEPYALGSGGPASADALPLADRRIWEPIT